MTEEDMELIQKLKDEWWQQFSASLRDTLNKAPRHLRTELLMRLGESSSVYGADLRGVEQ